MFVIRERLHAHPLLQFYGPLRNLGNNGLNGNH